MDTTRVKNALNVEKTRKVMRVKVKKVFNGYVSVRDYVVKKCANKREDLLIEHDDKFMKIPFSTLIDPSSLHTKEFISKYDGSKYTLNDFKWNPVDESQLDIWD